MRLVITLALNRRLMDIFRGFIWVLSLADMTAPVNP